MDDDEEKEDEDAAADDDDLVSWSVIQSWVELAAGI